MSQPDVTLNPAATVMGARFAVANSLLQTACAAALSNSTGPFPAFSNSNWGEF